MRFGIRSLIFVVSFLCASSAFTEDTNIPSVSASTYQYKDPYTGLSTVFPNTLASLFIEKNSPNRKTGEERAVQAISFKSLLNVQGKLTFANHKSPTQRTAQYMQQEVGIFYGINETAAWILRHARGAQEISQEITQLFAKQGTCVSVKMNKKDKYQHLSKASEFIVLSCTVNNEPTKIATALIQSPIRGTYQVMVMAESAQNAEKILDQMLLKTQIQADQAAADDIASNFDTIESTQYQQGMLGEVGSEGDQE